MKGMRNITLLVALFSVVIFAQGPTNEYRKAMERLDNGKELYFAIYIQSASDIEQLNNLVSLNKVVGGVAYAYANKKEFGNFLNTMNLMYQVEEHPGEREGIFYSPSERASQEVAASKFKYPSYDNLIAQVKKYETDFPDICKYYEVGKSIQGRVIPALVLTNKATNFPKPRVLFCGPPHGNELTGLMLNMALYDTLTKGYTAGNSRFKRILDSVEIVSVTIMNPDGTYRGGNSSVSGAQRANSAGVDLNRSYLPGPGLTAEAQPQTETIALRNFLATFKTNLTLATDFHDGIQAVLIPWGGKSAKHHEDKWYMNAANFTKNKSNSGFADGVGQPINIVQYNAPGCFHDHGAYHCRGTKAFCWELSSSQPPAESQLANLWNMYSNALFSFTELALTGIQGVVTDSLTGKPIADVMVNADSYDKDSSWVYSYQDGGYYKLMATGSYNLSFTHKDYVTRTISGVSTTEQQKTVLNVKMVSKNSAMENTLATKSIALSINKTQKGFTFARANGAGVLTISIFNFTGQQIKKIIVGDGVKKYSWDCLDDNNRIIANGCYIVYLSNGRNQSMAGRLLW